MRCSPQKKAKAQSRIFLPERKKKSGDEPAASMQPLEIAEIVVFGCCGKLLQLHPGTDAELYLVTIKRCAARS
jgi:hypothetical protein